MTTATNVQVVNFLGVTLDLFTKPHTKALPNRRYVNNESNHPPTILNNLHKSIQFRLTISSTKGIFDDKIKYIKALAQSKQSKIQNN